MMAGAITHNSMLNSLMLGKPLIRNSRLISLGISSGISQGSAQNQSRISLRPFFVFVGLTGLFQAEIFV